MSCEALKLMSASTEQNKPHYISPHNSHVQQYPKITMVGATGDMGPKQTQTKGGVADSSSHDHTAKRRQLI